MTIDSVDCAMGLDPRRDRMAGRGHHCDLHGRIFSPEWGRITGGPPFDAGWGTCALVNVLRVDVGDVVDDFSLPDANGDIVSLYGMLQRGPVVLFFYPGAMTSGCTKESCHFRDLGHEFATFGATPLGVSMDTVDKQREFAETYTFGFPLLSDEKGAVADQFGVRRRWMTFLPVRRGTFVIAQDHKVLGVVMNEMRMDVHADRALEILRTSLTSV